MKQTTLCYIEKDNAYLMLHRIKKENDENKKHFLDGTYGGNPLGRNDLM